MKNKKIVSMAALIAASLSAAQAQTIAGWNFENLPILAPTFNPAPSTDNSAGVVSAASIGMNIYATPNVGVNDPDVLLGVSSDTGANGVANLTQTWRIRGQAGSSGAANGWSSAAPIGTQGAQFYADTTGFNGIQVSFDWYATTQGEANMQFLYTVNGGTIWQNLALTLGGSDTGLQVLSNSGSDVNTVTGSYVSDNVLTGGSKAGQDWFTGLTASITDPNAANDPGFGIEMVNASTGTDDVSTKGTALNNSSGNWRFDNVVISGTAVPEPSTLALGSFMGLTALVGLRRLKNRQS